MGKVQSDKTQMTSSHRRGVTASPAWDTPSLMMESAEINGARKLLCKLQQCFEFSMTPSVPMKCRGKVTGIEGTDYFPLDRKYRKLAGELADKIRSTGAVTCVEGHWQPVETEDTLGDLLN